MWLDLHFWQYAKCTKEDALVADFLVENRGTPQYLYLKCRPSAFTDTRRYWRTYLWLR